MLMICEKDILAKSDPDVRWRYVSKGWFINDCIQNREYFNELKCKLEYDLLYHMEQIEQSSPQALNDSIEMEDSDSQEDSEEYKVEEEQKIQKGFGMSLIPEVEDENTPLCLHASSDFDTCQKRSKP